MSARETTLLSMIPALILIASWSSTNLDMILEVVTGSEPKRTAVGPLRTESTCSAFSLEISLRAILNRLFLATIKVPSALSASVRRLF